MGTFVGDTFQKGSQVLRYTNYYATNECFRRKVNNLYASVLREKELDDQADNFVNDVRNHAEAINSVLRERFDELEGMLNACLGETPAQQASEEETGATTSEPEIDPDELLSPFDRRLDRVYVNGNEARSVVPFDTRYQQAATSGYTATEDVIRNSGVSEQDQIIKDINRSRETMRKDDYFIGVQSLVNTYSVTRLYGSKGGEYIVDRKNRRQWYEVDQANDDQAGFSKNPTTTSLINWGKADPYGRTPYHFTDFVFCKHWKRVENNRLITLRRFPAPILDNLHFPGIDGTNNPGNPQSSDDSGNATNDGTGDQGSGQSTSFPPMATAVTYFGEETDNKLSELLNFSTGFNWGDLEAAVFEASPTGSTPGAGQDEAGPGGIYGSLSKYSRMLNISQGNWNQDAVLNKGQLPPDPYENGPYENRIIGPVNRISSVKRREPGINYDNQIELTFTYVARPVGGVNTKAAILDIISNFLVMGSATAMFWGGQHRFMGNPQQYPFLGGDEGIQQWYRGNPVQFGETTMNTFADGVGNFGDMAKNFFDSLFGGGGGEGGFLGNLKNMFTGEGGEGGEGGGGAVSNMIKHDAAKKSRGGVPYLQGMRALLIGEPVGEWHVTVGNPLNPIAMIGNLICKNMEVEFGDELGPDDFPTEVKFKVSLEHGMARDRDAIQSMFNRGMGRIYDLPDNFAGTADFETEVDKVTGHRNEAGRNPHYHKVPVADSGTVGGNFDKAATRENAMHGSVSVWNRSKFRAVSPNENLDLKRNALMNRSAYRASDWVTRKTLG